MTILTEELLDTRQVPVPVPVPTTSTSAPPPAYEKQDNGTTTDDAQSARLPANVWLQVIDELTKPIQHQDDEETPESGRFFLHQDLRLVSRALFLYSMANLRTHYLPQYLSLIKAPYSSDPWSGLTSNHRETRVLDLFIAVKVRGDVERVQSSLFEERDVTELFSLWQPRARLEDLMIQRGLKTRVLCESAATPTKIIATDITCTLTLRHINIFLPFTSQSQSPPQQLIRRNVLTLQRDRHATLEQLADEVLRELAQLKVRVVVDALGRSWYEEEEEDEGEERQEDGSPAPTSRKSLSSWFKKKR